mgnify:CR=1 FL=1
MLASDGRVSKDRPSAPFQYKVRRLPDRRCDVLLTRLCTLCTVQQHIASLAYLGRYAALSDFTGSDYAGVKGAKLTGTLSWLFWRSAYLSSLGSWRNRLQVPMDWARTLIFGRDVNSF